MKLSLAANYDIELIEKIADYPVEEVYGRLTNDFFGGGRPSYMAGKLSKNHLHKYVTELQKKNIQFNYLLNSSCLANCEWTKNWQKKFNNWLAELREMGVRRLTLSTPFLVEAVKKRFPEFYVRIGIFAQIDTPRRARFWQNLGADAITLESFSINRDFQTLADIRRAVTCDLHLIANHPCLPNCPLQSYHQNGFAHSSGRSKTVFIDYCFLRCTRHRIENASTLIQSPWIRPEDIRFYEQLGISHFKILERDIPSAELLKRVVSYATRTSPANLADIILPYAFRDSPKRSFWGLLRHFLKPSQINPFQLRHLLTIASRQGMLFPLKNSPFYIDSAKIPDTFIEGFQTRDCKRLECSSCRYCDEIAASAVTLDPPWRLQQLQNMAALESQLLSGKFWNV